VVAALYRRYRPETFAELIGQSQVTDPLRTALRTDRVNHAYLFSGPRGCGKTTSARILARCLNCAEGPTDTPCGVCPSCVELARDGSGSLDVVEIDAAAGTSYLDCFRRSDRRRTEIVMMVFAMQLLSGENLIGQGVQFLQNSGLDTDTAFSLNMVLNSMFIIGTIFSWGRTSFSHLREKGVLMRERSVDALRTPPAIHIWNVDDVHRPLRHRWNRVQRRRIEPPGVRCIARGVELCI
jgi:DNA polymerase III delta prime subunit